MCGCCDCADTFDPNYLHCSNGMQAYAAGTAGPYIATTHVPGEYGPTYVA
ncbi:hypothetical protein [Bifidobacterium gallicum]|uniref:Uncharacterized protein n=1 Tax=Bifidobacterium gallicum DSM 20093 = LMG 11596 TaxID=561180 RepID=D1NRQ9_9BIFI|nr:hypothetical protein [Bifidobacterium gallicum]EFA23898.1 hypothetical protein BIFGAL_03008 [Bifidobacterium gallicum DSM 20093 = LMG 11596]KFI59123.1 hypothetical protein BGLCM_0709 [Bifidobacterium gallicum DSM 20093 = LMG 11596]